METIIRLWKTPAAGRLTSTISGSVSCMRGKKDALDGLAHPRVFHRRLADDGGGVDGALAVGDAGDVEDRVVVLHGVEAGVIAEGAFRA